MVRLNLVLMIVLSLGVVGGAGYLAVSGGGQEAAENRSDELLRRLGDSDPDVVREAMEEIREAGLEMVAALEEASASPDELLARRADRLLAELTGSVPAPDLARGNPEEPSEPPAEEDEEPSPHVRLQVDLPQSRVVYGDEVRVYVSFHNEGPAAVQVARDRAEGMVSWARFGAFEIVGGDGKVIRVPSDPWGDILGRGRPQAEMVVLESGVSMDLYAGQGDGSASIPVGLPAGSYTLRFVYDAGEGSDYREQIDDELQAMALPPQRLVSNEVTLTITPVQ